jgi:2-oxoglutarate dehydrogenase complex dehydrogenase (E1) component-like enzyme
MVGPRGDLEGIRAQRPLTTLENCLFDRLIEEAATGTLSHDALSSCVKGALSERMEANMRATEIHVQTKSPHDRPELMRRLRSSLEQVDLEETCKEVLERRVRQAKRKPGFDWEENLGVPK